MLSSDDLILNNLKDAGCNGDLIGSFMACLTNSDRKGAINLLIKHRKILLIELHKCQKQIDCLDYLIFDIEQNSPFERKK